MKYILCILTGLLVSTGLLAAPHGHPNGHPNGHPGVRPGGPNRFNPNNPHFNQAGVVRNNWGYSYRGFNWNFWGQRRFFANYNTTLYWNPYAVAWYYWCQPDGAWYPTTYAPYGIYNWADSPDPVNPTTPPPPTPVPTAPEVLPTPKAVPFSPLNNPRNIP